MKIYQYLQTIFWLLLLIKFFNDEIENSTFIKIFNETSQVQLSVGAFF